MKVLGRLVRLLGPEGLLGDLRHALRIWSGRRSVFVVAVVTLSVGLGSTTAMLSLVRTVILRSVPWPEANRLVAVHAVLPDRSRDPALSGRWNRWPITPEAWGDLQRASVFKDVGVWIPTEFFFRPPGAERLTARYVSTSILRLLGVRPLIGRSFSPVEDNLPSDAVLVGSRFWQQHLGGRADVLGEPIVLFGDSVNRGIQYRVIGVFRSDPSLPGEPPDLLLPIGGSLWLGSDREPRMRVIGRLADHVTLRQATAAVEPLVRREWPPEKRTALVIPLRDDEIAVLGWPLWAGLTGAVLLLAVCTLDVTGILLKNACTRRQELSVRQALGATPSQICRQLVAEHILLAGVSAVCGLALARVISPVLVRTTPWQAQAVAGVKTDWWVVAVTGVVAVLAGIAGGVAPSLSFLRTSAGIRLLAAAQPMASVLWAQRRVVAFQVALSLVLVVAASLLGDAYVRLAFEPLGFDPARVVVIGVRTTFDPTLTQLARDPLGTVEPSAARSQLANRMTTGWTFTAGLLDALRRTPGVVSAAGVERAPFTRPLRTAMIAVPSNPALGSTRVCRLDVTEGYFGAMGIRVLKGRAFAVGDHRGELVAVVSAALERRLLAGHAEGQQFDLDSRVYRIVGVVEDVVYQRHIDDTGGTCYLLDVGVDPIRYLVVRTVQTPELALKGLREVVRRSAPYVAVTSNSTMADLVQLSFAEERFGAVLAGGYGVASLAFAAVGILFLTARSVVERRREIGVRVALGAGPEQVRALLLRDAIRAMGAGVLAGLPFAYAVSHALRGAMAGAGLPDYRLFVWAPAILLSVGGVTTWVVAQSASRAASAFVIRE